MVEHFCSGYCRKSECAYDTRPFGGCFKGLLYMAGYRGCCCCNMLFYVEVDRLRCPCCNERLAVKPRTSGSKRRYERVLSLPESLRNTIISKIMSDQLGEAQQLAKAAYA